MALHLERGTVDITANNLDLRQVLSALFMQMGVRYDLPPEVQGTVTVDLHHVSYQQALELLLGNEYEYTIGPHDTIYIHQRGTTWRPGHEEAA